MSLSNSDEIRPGGQVCPPGASLPPRKRLLAGLKQNGWVSSLPPADHPPSMQEAELPLPPPAVQFAQLPARHEPEREGRGESGDEKIQQSERNADEDVNIDKNASGSKRQESASPVAANSRVSAKKLLETTSESHNQGGSKLQRNSKALTAAKTVAEVKVIAADKTSAVVKSSIEASAVADCDVAHKRRRKSTQRHVECGFPGETEESRELEMKQEIKIIGVSQVPPPVDDEELARQLHRAMNSSPRISRNLTTCQRSKEDGTSLSSSQRHYHHKDEQGKRRALPVKNVEKPEIKTSSQSHDSSKSHCGEAEVQVESMNTRDEMSPVNDTSQLRDFSQNKFSNHIISDSTPLQGHAEDMVRLHGSDVEHLKRKNESKPKKKLSKDDFGLLNGRKDHGVTESTSALKNESVHSNEQMSSNSNFKDSTVKGSGMDVEQSVNQSASHVRDQKAAGSRNTNKKRSGGLRSSNEMHGMHSEREIEEAERQSTIMTEPPLAVTSSVAENQDVKEKPNGDLEYDELPETGRPNLPEAALGVHEVDYRGEGDPSVLSSGSRINEEGLAEKEGKDSSDSHTVLKRKCSDNRSSSMLKKLSLVERQACHQESLREVPKGCSAGKQTFGGGGRSLTPFRSAPPVSLGTFASGSNARHS